MTKNEKQLAVQCCGFRFFVGDLVIVDNTEYYVTKINLTQRSILLTRLNYNEIVRTVNLSDKIKIIKTGKRLETLDYPLLFLKKIYKSLSSSSKAFYLYHYYKCNKEKIGFICRKLKLSKIELKDIFISYKEKGYFDE